MIDRATWVAMWVLLVCACAVLIAVPAAVMWHYEHEDARDVRAQQDLIRTQTELLDTLTTLSQCLRNQK